jgi:CRP-like cAMP-binding protein
MMDVVTKKFVETLSKISFLSEGDLLQIAEIASIKELNPGDFWVYEGMFAKDVAFIFKGYLRKYFIIDGNEKTDWFYFENSFTGDMPSIIEQTACKSCNVAMESTTLIVLSYAKLNELSSKSQNIDHLLRVFIEYAFIAYYKRAMSFILQSPKERYEQLIAEFPMVTQRATQYHIASYLGITPQHLSRIRNQK